MEGEGMVAVVRGLRDAGLAVTLLDGNRQYTLMPNSITNAPTNQNTAGVSTQQPQSKQTHDSSTEFSVPQCDSGAQAIDGRYASMYKTAHCHMRPTSPPIQLTEFPPQRAELYPGHGNFQVGGIGSGATSSPIRASSPTSFRGGMSWPDRGSVCSPRPSHEVDAFANSLRKYPNLSPDRSSEVVERLINYTQAKGLSKTYPRTQTSPNRLSEPTSHHTLDPKSTPRCSRPYEPEVTIRAKRVEETPTRDKKRDEHLDFKCVRGYDVKCIRDISKRLRDCVKSVSSYPYNHPVCPTIKETHDYPPYDNQNSTNSVNMEIQAAVKMISKEVGPIHRDQPNGSIVAASNSPTSSTGERNNEGECYIVPSLETNTSFKSIQTTFCPSDLILKPRKSVQTVCSSVDIYSKHERNRFDGRKSKSQEEIKVTDDDLRRSLLELIEDVSGCTKSKNRIRDELIKKLFDTDRGDKDDDNASEKGTKKHKSVDKYVSTFCPSGCDYIGDFKELVGKLKHCYGDTKNVLHETKPHRLLEYKQLDYVLKNWINNLNIQTVDPIDGPFDKIEIRNTVEEKIKTLFKCRTKQDFNLKSEIVKIIEEIPLEVNVSYNKKSYLHKLVDLLLKRLKNVVIRQQIRNRRNVLVNRSKKILTEEDIRHFLKEKLLECFNECHLKICDNMLEEIENELIDVLIDSIDCIRCGHLDDASDEMEVVLQDLGQMTEKQADYITNVILRTLQEMLNQCNFNQTYMVLHSNVSSTNNTDLSIGNITEGDIRANLDSYTNQLNVIIQEWLDTLNLPLNQDKGFREVVVNDLAGDIVDRHKYLELNPHITITEEDELNTLKYQIFKWINKLVSEDNTETIASAKELMTKIKTVPVPMLSHPLSRNFDPMRPCLLETGIYNCKKGPVCGKPICRYVPKTPQGHPESPGTSTAPDKTISGQSRPSSQKPSGGPVFSSPTPHTTQNTQGFPGLHSQTAQTSQAFPGFNSQAAQTTSRHAGHHSYSGQGGHSTILSKNVPGFSHPGQYTQGQGGPPPQGHYSFTTHAHPDIQGNYSHVPYSGLGTPGSYSHPAQPGQIPQRYYSQPAQGSPHHPGPYGQVMFDQSHVSQGSYGPGFQIGQGSPIQYSQGQGFTPAPILYGPTNVQSSPGVNLSNVPQASLQPAQSSPHHRGSYGQVMLDNSQVTPGSYSQDFQNIQGSSTPYNQQQSFGTSQAPYGRASINITDRHVSQSPAAVGPAISPGLVLGSTPRNPAGNFTQMPMHSTGGAGTGPRRMSSPGRMVGQVTPIKQSMYDPSQQPIYGAGPSTMSGTPQGVQITTSPQHVEDIVSSPGVGIPSTSYYSAPQAADSLAPGTSVGAAPNACCPYQNGLVPTPTSLKQLNDEYDEYLKEWVQRIPIAASSPAEQQLVEKARLGIYNGIWKAITKMKLNHEIFTNRYYYQDVFDDELEALLGNLPKTKELEDMKHRLKAELLEKTVAMNELITETNSPASFKQQLIENIENNLPKRPSPINEDDPSYQNEEIQKLNLAENYILYTRYKDEDSVKTNVYKKTFLKKLDELLNTVKNNYGVDTNTYANEIINSLDKVPVPHINYIKNEADDILLGMEVENWISDIPQNPDNTLPLEKRRIRDGIVKKVQELGTVVAIEDCSFARLLKMDLPTFLEKIPIQQGVNMDFILEELGNRLRNLSRDIRHKSVSFQESLDYAEFSRNMPASSSFTEAPGAGSEHDSSYMIVGGNIVHDSGPKTWVSYRTPGPEEEQWHSMEQTQAPSGFINWSQGNQSVQPQSYIQNVSGQMPVSGNFPGDISYSTPVGGQEPIQGSTGTYGPIFLNDQAGIGPESQTTTTKSPCCINPACLNKPQNLTQGPAGQYSQSGPYSSTPYNQRQSFGSAQAPYGQGLASAQGSPSGKFMSASSISQLPQASYGQGFPNIQVGPIPYNQGPSFGPVPAGYGQTSNIQADPYNQMLSQGAYGQGFPAVQGGQVPYIQGQSFDPQTTYGQDSNIQGFGPGSPVHTGHVPGTAGYYSQGYASGQPGQVQPNVQLPGQRPGSPHKPNLQQMAGGEMGILGTSQMPGPSSQMTPQQYQIPGAQQLPAAQPEFYKSTDSEEYEPSSCNCGTVPIEQHTTAHKPTERKFLDIDERELFNIKSVQTAFSTIDIKTTKCKYCEIRSKSQEELTKITKTQEIITRKDLGRGDLQQEATEWFEIHSDKVKVKLWGDRMLKLAETLKRPGGEEKLRIKIEKYLKKVPEQFSEGDDERVEFRKQLPDDIIRKLKKMYSNPTNGNVNVYRLELSKYCSKFKIEHVKKLIMNWLKKLHIKKKDFLGRTVKKDEVFKYVTEKLEPLVLDRPQSDTEYKNALKTNITDILEDLPIVLGSHNKEFYVNKVTDTLVNDIFNIDRNIPSAYIQPTIREIKEFVKDEITYILEKSRVAISTKRVECLETELVDILLDLTDIVDIDNYVIEDITMILKDIGKLPEYKSKYFTNLLLRDYKEFFLRQSLFQENDKSELGRPDVYSVFQNSTDTIDNKEVTSFEVYTRRLVKEINTWLPKINIASKDKNFVEMTVKDLASDIVDRYKNLLVNPNNKGTDAEESQQLKFQILKWTNKLVDNDNTAVLEHAQELIEKINNIPKPLSLSSTNDHSSNQNEEMIETQTYIEKLTSEIYDWFHDLPINLHVSQEASLNKQLIKDFAEGIEKCLSQKHPPVIDNEVDEWIKKVLNKNIQSTHVEQLKNRIKTIKYTEAKVEKDPKREKAMIRAYEDIIDEWLDIIPIEPKKEGLFIDTRNEFAHELAVKLYNMKNKLSKPTDEMVKNKMREEISDWMKKLPLHQQADKRNYREKYAAKLVQSIQSFNIDDLIGIKPMQTKEEFDANQLEIAMLKWLKKLSLYRNKNEQDKQNQKAIMIDLANHINGAIYNGHSDLDEDIIEHIKMLDPNRDEEFVQNIALQLKLYLHKLNMFEGITQRHDTDDKLLIANVETWLKHLELNITNVASFNHQKRDFIDSMKRLKLSGSDRAVFKKEIITFMKSLPIDSSKKSNEGFLKEEATKLLQNLTMIPTEDVAREFPSKTNEIVSDAIKDWAKTLPLRSVYCPRELRSFIDDMSLVLTSLIVHPEHTTVAENDRRLNREIFKFLRRFPLKRTTEEHIMRIAEDLVKTLKNLHLSKEDGGKNGHTNDTNIAVYGVSLKNTNTTDNDFSIGSIHEEDINANLDRYTRQLVQQISAWYDNLNLPNVQEPSFKEVVINDLAGDIVDRHKYLELNPESGDPKEDELEHLKYQIFKWINKLVGDENLETIDHADDLMHKIQTIPVPMLVKPSKKSPQTSTSYNSPKSINQSANIVNAPVTWQQVNELPIYGPPTGGGSLRESPHQTSNRMSSPGALGIPNTTKCCPENQDPVPPPPIEGTKDAIYEKYQRIFREKCNALPIDKTTPQNAQLAELAITSIYNGIIRTFFKLKSDPQVENDYGYFEFMLEEKLEEMLDVLPQTEELVNKRYAWKLEILTNAIDMLDELHGITDRPSFRQRVRNKFNRNFAKDLELEQCFLLQQGFLAEMADAYILESKYKESDPLKTNVYKHRLMKKIDGLVNHLSKEHNVGFRFFKKPQLARIAMKVLEQVPIPNDDILQEEAEEIQIADLVEKWYKELPTKPLVNDTDGVLRKRMMDLLAKKLSEIEKRVNDSSKEAQMKHEMSQFLEKRAKLQQDQDLNINFMVEELNNRLKNRWLNEPIDYSAFNKDNPLSSTLAQVDTDEFLAPSMDAATNTSPLQGHTYQEIDASPLREHKSILKSNQVVPGQAYVTQPGVPMQSIGQGHPPLTITSPYVGNVDPSQMGPSQGYVSHSIQGQGQVNAPQDIPYGDNLVGSQYGPSRGYVSQQEVPMHNMAQGGAPSRLSPYETSLGTTQIGPSKGYITQSPQMQSIGQKPTSTRGIHGANFEASQFGPSEGYITQQGPPMQSMAHAGPSPRSMHEPPLGTSHIGPAPGYTTLQGQARTSISQVQPSQRGSPYGRNLESSPERPPQGYMTEQGPSNQMQSIAHTSTKSPRGKTRTSQVASSPRMQNINQSLGQRELTSQGGPVPHSQLHNTQGYTSYGAQGQVKFSSSYPNQRQTPPNIPEDYPGSQAPTAGYGTASAAQADSSTAQIGSGSSDEGIRDEYLVRCKCLEAFRRRRRCYDFDERCPRPRYRPYRCYY